jgi:hypothetical protein
MNWPPKDWRALLALLGSIAGAAALTILVAAGVWTLLPGKDWWSAATEAQRLETIRWVLWIGTGTIAVVILGLGFAINRRSFKGTLNRDGATLDFEGGEDGGQSGSPSIEVPPVSFGSGVDPK